MAEKIKIPDKWWKVKNKKNKIFYVSKLSDSRSSIIFYSEDWINTKFAITRHTIDKLNTLFDYVNEYPIKTTKLPAELIEEIGQYKEINYYEEYWIHLK